MPTSDGTVSKRLLLYRNGDKTFRPITFHYSSKKFRTWGKIEEEIQKIVPLRNALWGKGGTGVKVLWTTDGREKIGDVPALHNDDSTAYVIGGPEAFISIEGGYESIPRMSPDEERKDPGELNGSYYREKHKNLYEDRPSHMRIYNRDPTTDVKKMQIYKNGDEKFMPKAYVLRKKQTPTWKTFLGDVTRLVPPDTGGKVDTIYSIDGKYMIEEFEELDDGSSYVAAEGYYEKLVGGYENIGKDKQSAKTNKKKKKKALLKDEDGTEVESAAWEDQNLLEKDAEILQKHKRKNEGERREKDKLYNRKDQYKINNYQIYAFRNGQGMENQSYIFTESQIARGLPWVCEQVAKKFKINGKKLLRMNGSVLEKSKDIINRGAYVLLPHGEAFRATWYYLPDEAVDTSTEDGRPASYESQDSRTESGREDNFPRPDKGGKKGKDYQHYDFHGRKQNRSPTPERRKSKNRKKSRSSSPGYRGQSERRRSSGYSEDDYLKESKYRTDKFNRRTHSEDYLYSKRRDDRKKGSNFRADSGRYETRGAKPVKESRRKGGREKSYTRRQSRDTSGDSRYERRRNSADHDYRYSDRRKR